MQRAEIEKYCTMSWSVRDFSTDSETTTFCTATQGMIPADANHPDKTATIRTAGDKRRSALQVYSLALQRFTDFIIHGVIPDDLKE